MPYTATYANAAGKILRPERWERLKKAWKILVHQNGKTLQLWATKKSVQKVHKLQAFEKGVYN